MSAGHFNRQKSNNLGSVGKFSTVPLSSEKARHSGPSNRAASMTRSAMRDRARGCEIERVVLASARLAFYIVSWSFNKGNHNIQINRSLCRRDWYGSLRSFMLAQENYYSTFGQVADTICLKIPHIISVPSLPRFQAVSSMSEKEKH